MELIKKGGSVFFFPEGTRSKDGKLGPFKVSFMSGLLRFKKLTMGIQDEFAGNNHGQLEKKYLSTS